jgi:hypothetical protein
MRLLHDIWLVFLWANLYKANFIIQLFAKLSFKILVYKGQITTIHYILARHIVLGETQQSQNNRHHHSSECMALSSYLRVSSQILNYLETQQSRNNGHHHPSSVWL